MTPRFSPHTRGQNTHRVERDLAMECTDPQAQAFIGIRLAVREYEAKLLRLGS